MGLVSVLLLHRPERRCIIQSDWNEQSSTKKDPDASTSLPNGRDRRYVPLYSRALLRFIKPRLCSFRRDADDTGTFLPFRYTLRVINSSQRILQPGTSGPPWHNLRKWGTSDTNLPEQQSGTVRRGPGKTEKPRTDKSDSGVYVQSFASLVLVQG